MPDDDKVAEQEQNDEREGVTSDNDEVAETGGNTSGAERKAPDPDEKIFSSQGVPYKTEQVARSAIDKKGLSHNDYMVRSYEDGYIIVPKPKILPEKYYRVKFSHKAHPNDEEDVTLIVNGAPLVIARGVEVIIPGRYKECADHATYPQFTQRPNEERKIVGTIKVFPYSLLGEASEEEYLELLAVGNEKTKEKLAAGSKLID